MNGQALDIAIGLVAGLTFLFGFAVTLLDRATAVVNKTLDELDQGFWAAVNDRQPYHPPIEGIIGVLETGFPRSIRILLLYVIAEAFLTVEVWRKEKNQRGLYNWLREKTREGTIIFRNPEGKAAFLLLLLVHATALALLAVEIGLVIGAPWHLVWPWRASGLFWAMVIFITFTLVLALLSPAMVEITLQDMGSRLSRSPGARIGRVIYRYRAREETPLLSTWDLEELSRILSIYELIPEARHLRGVIQLTSSKDNATSLPDIRSDLEAARDLSWIRSDVTLSGSTVKGNAYGLAALARVRESMGDIHGAKEHLRRLLASGLGVGESLGKLNTHVLPQKWRLWIDAAAEVDKFQAWSALHSVIGAYRDISEEPVEELTEFRTRLMNQRVADT